MAVPINLPESMRPQWQAFERALRRWAFAQCFASERLDAVLVEVRAHYLACAVPDSELRVDDHQAALVDLQDWAVLVAYRLALRLLELELHRASAATFAESVSGPVFASSLPAASALQWQYFCAKVRRSVAANYSRAAIEAALSALGPLWLELARPLPPLAAQHGHVEAERLLCHVNDWAFAKQLVMLQALARAEHAALASTLAGVPSASAAAPAVVLSSPARRDSS